MTLSLMVVFQRLIIITLITGIVGYERERRGRAAGFRTHMLVGLGSCLVMLTGLYLKEELGGTVPFDPSRMAAQVVSGIGFLGAGTILRFGTSVRGLTTAASLWAVGGIGIAVGAGFLSGALIASAIVVIALFGLSRLEQSMRREWYYLLCVDGSDSNQLLNQIRKVLETFESVEISDFTVKEMEDAERKRIELSVKLPSVRTQDAIVQKLMRVQGIQRVFWD